MAQKRAREDAKAIPGVSATKRAKPSANAAATLPKKKSAVSATGARKKPAATADSAPTVVIEVDFPRGGAPAAGEQKRKATKRATETNLFRTQSDETLEVETRPESRKTKRRRVEANGAETTNRTRRTDSLRVEHLNYKRLTSGTLVLAQITAIRPLELIVSLPNQLSGHIPIVNISSHLTQRLVAAAANDNDASDDDEEERDTVPELEDLFAPGQFFACVVVTVLAQDEARRRLVGHEKTDEVHRASRRVELSLDPTKVNAGVTKADLVPGFKLNVAVKSVEDRGFVLDLGVEGTTAFVKSDVEKPSLTVGAIVPCTVVAMSSNARTCVVSIVDAELAPLATAPNASALLPGTLVSCFVTAAVADGLNVKFFDLFDGTVDLFHTGRDPALDHRKSFKSGKKVSGRVLWSIIDQDSVRFALSLADAVVRPGRTRSSIELSRSLSIGHVVDLATVVRVEPDWGLVCSFELEGGATANGFVHISHLSDDRVASLSTGSSGPWRVGTSHRARVVGFSHLDNLVQLSLQQSVLEKRFMRVADLHVGEILQGTIKKVDDKAIFVDIQGNVDGVVWPLHFSDVKLKNPERKFKPGASVRARVFALDLEHNRVILTLKRLLIESIDSPIVTNAADASVGALVLGVVSRIMNKALLLDLLGGQRALVPISEVAEGYVDDLHKLFLIGQVLRVRVTEVNVDASRIVASLRKAVETDVDLSQFAVGASCRGRVSALHADNIILRLRKPSDATGLLSFSTLAQHRTTTIEDVRRLVSVGDSIKKLVVVAKNDEKGIVIVGFPSDSHAISSAPTTAFDFDSLVIGHRQTVRVLKHTAHGAMVQLAKNLRGHVHWTDMADDYDEFVAHPPAEGDEVEAVVVGLEHDAKRVDISLRASQLNSTDEVRDKPVEEAAELEVGQELRGFVKNVSDAGLFVSVGRNVTARVLIREMFDEFVQEWRLKFSKGQIVQGKVLAIDRIKGQVEMSLRTSSGRKKLQSSLTLEDFCDGQVIDGIIKTIEKYGIFIRVRESTISGLCHKSEIVGDSSDDWQKGLIKGQAVRAVVKTVDLKTRRINFSMLPSRMSPRSSSASGEETDVESDDIEIDLGDATEPSTTVPVSNAQAAGHDVPSLPLQAKFSWGETTRLPGVAADEDEPSESDSNSDASHIARELLLPRDCSQLGLLPPKDLTAELATRTPTSAQEFERLALASPNSSYLWIQFMAFYLQSAEIEQARAIVQRALLTINFREEDEKFKVWIAALNLENAYGTDDTFEECFRTAARANDDQAIHLKALDILSQSGKYERAEQLGQRLVKKFGSSATAWTSLGQYYIRKGDLNSARNLLPRSLQSLHKREHVDVVVKFAEMEFKHGEPERARTILEGVLQTSPKRLDLWSIYIDLETGQGNIAAIRALFDRVLSLKLSSQKAKFWFKRALAFEKEHGNETGIERIKDRARAVAAALQKSSDQRLQTHQ